MATTTGNTIHLPEHNVFTGEPKIKMANPRVACRSNKTCNNFPAYCNYCARGLGDKRYIPRRIMSKQHNYMRGGRLLCNIDPDYYDHKDTSNESR